MEDLIKNKDSEITKLLVENRQLSDELRQCQADKEFVWSLWKRLQVSSPDLTQAISIVMEREREKTEIKDRKVLDILQSKDEEIKSLHETLSLLKHEKDDLYKLKTTLEVEGDTKLVNIGNLEQEITKLREHVEKSRHENVERSNSYGRSMKEVEDQRDELKVKMTGFLTDIQEMRTKLQQLEDQNKELNEKNVELREDVAHRNEAVRRRTEEKESIGFELEEVRRKYSQVKSGISDDLKSRDYRYKELKSEYEQLSEQNQQQSELINQLQSLQSSTKQVLSEQEETFRNEKKSLQQVNRDLLDANEHLKETQLNLKKESDSLRRQLEAQEEALKEGEAELRHAIAMATGAGKDYYHRDYKSLEEKIDDQRKEITALQRRLNRNSARTARSTHDSDGHIDQTFSPIIERGMGYQQAPRARSLSPCAQSRQLMMLQKRLKATETRLDDTKQLLELKKDEVREIQRAHNKRLERLKMLQQDYRILRSTRSDAEMTSSPRKNNSKHRSRSRDLRKENSETVWNELARYKRDNRSLEQERISLEEELDALRVQSAMDRATVQDLNICLKQERDEATARRRLANRDEERLCSTPKSKSEGRVSSRNVKNLERKLDNAADDNKTLKKDKKRLQQDNRNLKDEIKTLKLEMTDTRQGGTKLRLENSNLRHQVDGLKADNHQLEGELQNHRAEIESLKDENLTLRDENGELQQDIADLKLELADLNAELKDLDRSTLEADTARMRNKKGEGWKSPAAKKHQKFLNKSVQDLQEAFGDRLERPHPPSSASEDVSMPEDVGRSDASSLGQSIVRVCRRQKLAKRVIMNEEKIGDGITEDTSMDTHRSNRPPSRRPSYLPRHGEGGMMITLKQRLSSLQAQCTSLRAAKQNAVKKVGEEKERNIQLESELASSQNKLKNVKQTVQRLNREMEVMQRERDDLQQALTDARTKQPDPQIHSDADYKYLESKLKLANGETTRITEQLKQVKKDLERKMEQLTTEKEKGTRLERDVGMKRQLIDELRIKSKESETKLKDEYNAKLDLQDRLKLVDEDVNHKKNHIESIRRQLQACTKEKAKYELMYSKAREEIDKRCEQLSSMQAGKLEAESVTSRLEQEAEHQLQTLASRSEQALEKLKSRLERSEEKLGEFGTFVKNLTTQLINLLCRQREGLSREKMQISESQARLSDSGNKHPSSMSHAQKVACDILNMSRSDFEDLMAPVDASRRRQDDGEGEKEVVVATQHDETWRMRVEKIATENPPFAKSLSRLIWDKVQDVVRITEELYQVRTDQLEGEILGRKKF